MNIKKTILVILAAAGTEVSLAQQINVKPDSLGKLPSTQHLVQTNPFWDNWFAGAGAGAQIYFGDHDRQMQFSDRITPGFGFYVGKRFTPGIGVRAGVNRFKAKGLTQDINLSTGEKHGGKPWDGYWLYNQQFDYYNVYGDVMFNLSNMLNGYKEARIYSASPYIGLGFMVNNSSVAQKEINANLGLFNSFRLNDRFDLTFDVRGTMVNDRFDNEVGGKRYDSNLSMLAGISYKFKKQGWQKSPKYIINYNEEALNNLRKKVNMLSEDNDALKRQLDSAKNQTVTDIEVKEKILAAPILVTFPINKSTVNNEMRVNMGFFAKIIKSGSSSVVYKVTGYADKSTGSEQTNERLSKARAQAIYDLLVHEFEVNPSQLELDFKGGVANEFYDDPRLSRAVITIAK